MTTPKQALTTLKAGIGKRTSIDLPRPNGQPTSHVRIEVTYQDDAGGYLLTAQPFNKRCPLIYTVGPTKQLLLHKAEQHSASDRIFAGHALTEPKLQQLLNNL